MNKYSQFIDEKPVFTNEQLLMLYSDYHITLFSNCHHLGIDDFINLKEEILKRMICFEYTIGKYGYTELRDELQ